MSWKTVGLLALACAVGITMLMLDSDTGPKEAPVLSFQGDEVDELMVIRGPDTVLVRKAGESWQMVAPVYDMADDGAVGVILEQLQDTHADRAFSPEARLASFGLDPPELELVARTGDTMRARLALGSVNPAGKSRYAHTADTSVVLVVPERVFTRLATASADLRSTRLLQAPAEDIVAVNRTGIGQVLSLAKHDGTWELGMPVSARADDSAVRSLLRRLREPVVDEFLPGVSCTPAATWVVHTAASAETLDVCLTDHDSPLICSNLRGDAMVVDSSLAALLLAPVDTWRSRELLPFSAYEVQAIRFASALGETLAISKDGAGRWRVGTQAADAQSVMRLIRDLEAARVDFSDHAVDEWEPVMTLVAESRRRDSVAIQMGPLRAQGRVIFAQHLGGPALLVSPVVDTLTLEANAWRSRRVIDLDAFEVNALEVRLEGVAATATRQGVDGWKVSNHWASDAAPDSVVASVMEARLARFPEEVEAGEIRETATVRFTLDDGDMTIALWTSGSDSLLASVDGGPVLGLEADLLPMLRMQLSRR
ncbi:DUF4340 domain-containing protein [Candidatus Fermentibacteria bacterium]|nr:DUF4340 domain-containing protein [Candidatus Fermentibacteria bacterium]